MAASLTVKFTRAQLADLSELCWQLTAEVTGAVDMPAKVFIMHRSAEGSTEGNYQDQFETVGDRQDLERIPEDTPDLENEMPYYRTDSVSLLFKDALTLVEIENQMRDILQQTVDEFKALPAGNTEETVTFD